MPTPLLPDPPPPELDALAARLLAGENGDPAALSSAQWLAVAEAHARRLDPQPLLRIPELVADKALHKALRRLAHQLRSRGVTLPLPSARARVTPAEPPPSGHASLASLTGDLDATLHAPSLGATLQLLLSPFDARLSLSLNPSLRYQTPAPPARSPSASRLYQLPFLTPHAGLLLAEALRCGALKHLPSALQPLELNRIAAPPPGPDPAAPFRALALSTGLQPLRQLSLSADPLDDPELAFPLFPRDLKRHPSLLRDLSEALHPDDPDERRAAALEPVITRFLQRLAADPDHLARLRLALWHNAALLAVAPDDRRAAQAFAGAAEALDTGAEAPEHLPLLRRALALGALEIFSVSLRAADSEHQPGGRG
jgi:hypothetical protein